MLIGRIFLVYGLYSIIQGGMFVCAASKVISDVGFIPTPGLVATQQIWGAYLVGIGIVSLALWRVKGYGPVKEVVMGFGLLCLMVVVVTVMHFTQDFGAIPIYINFGVHLIVGAGLLVESRKL